MADAIFLDLGLSILVATEVFGDLASSLFMAGAVFGGLGASLFGAGEIFGDLFQLQKCVLEAQKVTAAIGRVAGRVHGRNVVESWSETGIMLGLAAVLEWTFHGCCCHM